MNRLRLCVQGLTCLRSTTKYEGKRHMARWHAPVQIEITKRKRALPPQPEPKRSNFLEWNRGAELYAFNQRLSEKFDMEKLDQAFTHRLYAIEEKERQKVIGIADPDVEIKHNHDLIATGRELTSKVVEKYLIKSLPRAPENVILAIHDYLTSMEVLADVSRHMGTKDIILTNEDPVTQKTLAETYLALVAALAESVSTEHASIFVRDFLIAVLAQKDLSEIWLPNDPLEALNEILHKDKRAPAEPRIIRHTGQNTILASYQIGLYSDKQFLGSGFGQNIEEAKEIAAANALCRMFDLLDSSKPIKYNLNIDVSS